MVDNSLIVQDIFFPMHSFERVFIGEVALKLIFAVKLYFHGRVSHHLEESKKKQFLVLRGLLGYLFYLDRSTNVKNTIW